MALAFHPDGHSLLATGAGFDARFWDTRTGAPLGPMLTHPSDAVSAALSPDGKIALTACWRHDGNPKSEVFRWNAATGEKLGRLLGLSEEVRLATFVRGGRAVLVVSPNAGVANPTRLRVFDAVSGE